MRPQRRDEREPARARRHATLWPARPAPRSPRRSRPRSPACRASRPCASRPRSSRSRDRVRHRRRRARVGLPVGGAGLLEEHGDAPLELGDPLAQLGDLVAHRPVSASSPPTASTVGRVEETLAELVALPHPAFRTRTGPTSSARPARSPPERCDAASAPMRSIQARRRDARRRALVIVEHHVKELGVGGVARGRVLEERIGDEVGGARARRRQEVAAREQALEDAEPRRPSRRRAARSAPSSGSSRSSSSSIAFGAALVDVLEPAR